MVISRTPFRMSFFGGGTDFPEFYKEYGGCVISTTIDKYCYVNVRHLPDFFDYKNQIIYSRIENVKDVSDIEHPAVREAMKFLNMKNLRVAYDADLPARSGLGTSSAFAVGMLNAFHALKGQYSNKKQLADEAVYLERYLCMEEGGIQDQIAASFGGLNRIDFSSDGYKVSPIIISNERKQELSENLMLFFTGFSRFSSDIQVNTKKKLKSRISELKEMKEIANEAEKILVDKRENLDDFGRLLHKSWLLKRSLSEQISTNEIDRLYEKAIKQGAFGGKILGAGGGGFLLLYVDKEHQEHIKAEFQSLLQVPFKFDTTGTQILFYSPETIKGEEYEL